MQVMTTAVLFSAAGSVAAIVAAACWFTAGAAKVSPERAAKMRAAHIASKGRAAHVAWTLLDGSDMEFTLRLQSQWSKRGALAAGVAALFQAASFLF